MVGAFRQNREVNTARESPLLASMTRPTLQEFAIPEGSCAVPCPGPRMARKRRTTPMVRPMMTMESATGAADSGQGSMSSTDTTAR
jgi:hypothetical protein